MTGAWVIRAGRYGERDQWALDNGVSGGGWKEVGDLTAATTRDAVADIVAAAFPGAAARMLQNYTAQLYALRCRIAPGDLIVLPLKTTKQIAIGRAASGYTYREDEVDPDRRHVVRVDWQRTDLPRTAVKQDLLFTLGSAMSIFAPTKNKAVMRLDHLLREGGDPGAVAPKGAGPRAQVDTAEAPADADTPELTADIEEVARIQIVARMREEFAGHGLAALVGAILEAEGFRCLVAPPGPDGGVDITAGRGLLGLDPPRILVQVKSGDAQIAAPIVTQLHGVMTTNGAEQGLLVAWGGLTRPARDALRNQHLRVRVWEAEDVVDAVLRTYDRLPDDIREKLPLRRVWMLSDAGL